jgi:hypothetical protein
VNIERDSPSSKKAIVVEFFSAGAEMGGVIPVRCVTGPWIWLPDCSGHDAC